MWISEHGIDPSNLEELLVQDAIEMRKETTARGSAKPDPSEDDSKSKYHESMTKR